MNTIGNLLEDLFPPLDPKMKEKIAKIRAERQNDPDQQLPIHAEPTERGRRSLLEDIRDAD